MFTYQKVHGQKKRKLSQTYGELRINESYCAMMKRTECLTKTLKQSVQLSISKGFGLFCCRGPFHSLF